MSFAPDAGVSCLLPASTESGRHVSIQVRQPLRSLIVLVVKDPMQIETYFL